MSIDLYIPNATYQRFLSSSCGTYEEKPERMAEFVVTRATTVYRHPRRLVPRDLRALGYGDVTPSAASLSLWRVSTTQQTRNVR